MQPKTKIMSAVLLKPKTVKVAATGSSLNLGNGQGRVINLQVSASLQMMEHGSNDEH